MYRVKDYLRQYCERIKLNHWPISKLLSKYNNQDCGVAKGENIDTDQQDRIEKPRKNHMEV